MSKLIPYNHYIHCTPKFDLLRCEKIGALLVDLCLFFAIVHMRTLEQSNHQTKSKIYDVIDNVLCG